MARTVFLGSAATFQTAHHGIEDTQVRLLRKGKATVRLASGDVCRVEVHWYEAHGIGRRRLKIKRFLE